MAAVASQRIELKSSKDLEHMRQAGRLAAHVLSELGKAVAPGVSTKALDELARRLIREGGGAPTFLGYRGYPAAVCVSLNEEVVHGIPSAKRVIRNGDIVSLDVGVTLEGFVGDTAATFAAGVIAEDKQKLLDVTRESLMRAVQEMRAGNRLGDVSRAVQAHAEANGFNVVRDFVGHGIGRKMHEEPSVPNYGSPHTGVRLDVGLVLALEPMVNLGGWRVKVQEDGWTVVTDDGKPSAHFEHTVAVTAKGPEILTLA